MLTGDPTFILLMIALAFALYAQYKVKSTFQKMSQVRTRNGYSGFDAAREILSAHPETSDVAIEPVPGSLTDHYDPRKRVLRLSQPVMRSDSVAAVGVAAHEAGHALQHADKYMPMYARNLIVPVASFGSSLAFPLFVFGLILSLKPLVDFGIVLFSLAVLFHIVTLPVEFNASARAVAMLHERGIITREEVPMAKKVLDAAALTYVASAAMALVQLVRMLLIRGRD
jgi:hypothetical protein